MDPPYSPTSLLQEFIRLAQAVTDFILPPLCFSCNEFLESPGAGICQNCLDSINPAERSNPVYLQTLDRLTADGLIEDLSVPWFFDKEGALQALVHRMKYQGFHRIGYVLGRRLGDCVAGECPVPIDFIVPVPLHRSKVRERGYNQSVHIARGVGAVTGWRSEPGCIERKRYTPSQTHLNAVEREANVAGAFVVPSSRSSMLAGASVLVVDDIVTTGATMRATALSLREAGAQRVVACAIALAR